MNAGPNEPVEVVAAKRGFWGRTKTFLVSYGRWLLLGAGLLALGLLIRSVGARPLWEVLVAAGPWLPLVLICDLSWVAFEGLAVLVLYGAPARQIPVRSWIQTTLVHYTTMAILPVGRAGAEVARATMMAPYVGKARATTGAAVMQTMTLLANTVMSALCFVGIYVAFGNDKLSWLVLANGGATLAAGAAFYVVMWRASPGGFLGRRFAAMAELGPDLDEHFRESRPRHALALLMSVTGRTLQTLQYGLLLLAVSGTFTLTSSLIAQGIHLVSAGFGDLVPNQVGVTEGVYRIFASALGLADHPEKAVGIAVLARVSSLSLSGLCVLVLQFMPKARAS